jgi:hypothetical protein
MDFDWYHHHVIYHGWNRRGWVNNARPYVHITNVYINRSRPYINQYWKHDASHGGPDRYRDSRPSGPYSGKYGHTPDPRGRATTAVRPSGGMFGYTRDAQTFSNRGRESRGAIQPRVTAPTPATRQAPTRPTPGISQQPARPQTSGTGQRQAAPTPSVSKAPARPAPSIRQQPAKPAPSAGSSAYQSSSGRGTPPPARAPSSAFGGYRGANEAKAQSLRGQASRQSNAGAPRPSAPASRGKAPAGKTAPKGKPVPQR